MFSFWLPKLAAFVFFYPLVMSIIWSVGGFMFYLRRERKNPVPKIPVEAAPLVSILVPAYNEAETIAETVHHLQNLNYPNYEVIVINDGSKDQTAEVLRGLSDQVSRLRVINLLKNSGKANALYMGLAASRGEILITLDADALLDPEALNFMVPHFTTPQFGERVGAVTGNPRVRNRSSLLGKIQVVEYASIIGLIKRAQRILGKVMTVSGVIVAFRKRALVDCGLWDKDLITDDIGVTWKLQRRFWDVRYEPQAVCWMLVPETLKGLFKQRVRWSQGGLEVLLRHWDIFFDYRQRRLLPIYITEVLSVIWSVAWVVTAVMMILGVVLDETLAPGIWPGIYLALVCVIQFLLAYIVERQYEPGIARYYIWAVWYPMVYWYFNLVIVLAAIPRALRVRRTKFATWDSPDRGLATGGRP